MMKKACVHIYAHITSSSVYKGLHVGFRRGCLSYRENEDSFQGLITRNGSQPVLPGHLHWIWRLAFGEGP